MNRCDEFDKRSGSISTPITEISNQKIDSMSQRIWIRKGRVSNESDCTGQRRSTLATLSNSFFHNSRLMVWSNKIFDGKTNGILSDRLHEILLKNREPEKNEFESRKCCECRSALTCRENFNDNSPLRTGPWAASRTNLHSVFEYRTVFVKICSIQSGTSRSVPFPAQPKSTIVWAFWDSISFLTKSYLNIFMVFEALGILI